MRGPWTGALAGGRRTRAGGRGTAGRLPGGCSPCPLSQDRYRRRHLEVHLGLAAEALHVGHEVALVGADRAAEGVVILKGGAEAEGQHGGVGKAPGDDAGVVAGSGLGVGAGQPGGVLGQVLGDDDR